MSATWVTTCYRMHPSCGHAYVPARRCRGFPEEARLWCLGVLVRELRHGFPKSLKYHPLSYGQRVRRNYQALLVIGCVLKIKIYLFDKPVKLAVMRLTKWDLKPGCVVSAAGVVVFQLSVVATNHADRSQAFA